LTPKSDDSNTIGPNQPKLIHQKQTPLEFRMRREGKCPQKQAKPAIGRLASEVCGEEPKKISERVAFSLEDRPTTINDKILPSHISRGI
jgi:hypothetical protein